jgi:hypothetical protein
MIVKVRFFCQRTNQANQCAFALCMPKLHITLANSPLTAFTRLPRHSSGRLHRAFHRRGRVSIGARLFGDSESGLDNDTDNIDRFFDGTQSWIKSLYTTL